MTVAQYKRKATLVITKPSLPANNPSAYVPSAPAKDLSAFHFTFSTVQQDVETPNNCAIRVYNLARATVDAIIKDEYSQVTLQAGYDGAFGVIFQGNIKQYRVGRESATTTYLDILAADGDLAYNYSIVNKTLAAGSTPADRFSQAVLAMQPNGVTSGYMMPTTGGVLPRGKVLFSPAPALIRQEALYQSATWNISNGKVNIVPLDGYLPGEAVVLNSLTGMIGMPEQTENGVVVSCLLNPRIAVGGLVRIDNKSVNQIMQAGGLAHVPYNSYVGKQFLATVSSDGLYRVYVAEHDGDTRGQAWYSRLTCLAVDPSTNKVLVK